MAYTYSSSPSARAILILTLCLGPCVCSAEVINSRFRGSVASRDEVLRPSDANVTSREEAGFLSHLDVLLSGGQGSAARRLHAIEASMWRTFQALPKNANGRLAPLSVRYIVHNYFAKEHGWQIKGLEPQAHRTDVTDVHEVGILQDKAPLLVEALLEAKQSDRGLSLSDVVKMAGALEWLILEESMDLLQHSYALNDQSAADRADDKSLNEVLLSYLIVLEQGGRANFSDVQRHQKVKAAMAKASSVSHQTLVDYEHNALMNFAYRNRYQINPFVPQHYSFEAASEIVEDMARGYGKWQNTECHQMKEHLMELDADGSGRVPLHVFYSQPQTALYQFSESLEYLQQVGALDESSTGNPGVRISNYMLGPSNCISTSRYYSVCCLSECDVLMNELEDKIRAPTASTVHLLGVVGNLSSSTVDAPRQLSDALAGKLDSIAERNGGNVPLHGRLFAQWLHFAFPNECPYPHVAETAAPLTPHHWLDGKASSTKEEREKHIDLFSNVANGMNAAEEPAADMCMSEWSDHEVLPLHEPQRAHETGARKASSLGSIMRVVVQLALCFVVLRMAFSWFSVAISGGEGKKKDLMLPLRV